LSQPLPESRRRVLALLLVCDAVLALMIAVRFVELRAEWTAWNTVVTAQATLIQRADTSVDPTSRPPPRGLGR
jgi:hypothetical protein